MPGEMRWWGWGDGVDAPSLPDHALVLLSQAVGTAAVPRPPVALEDVALPDPALPDAARAALAAAAGADHVRDDRAARVGHAAGRSYPDLVRLRSGAPAHVPDAVVYPGSHDDVRAVLDACGEHGVAVVPFGGGTSVVGGVEALRGAHAAVVTVDLRRLDALAAVDHRSLTATLEAGLRGPEAERLLGARGLTLGHFPQSFEYASIGGYAATRSAGQASTGYGRFDRLVLGLRCATPQGDLEVRPVPGSAAGPALRELIVGSEGTLGIITEVTAAVRPAPETARYEAWFFRSFAEGAEAFRAVEQARAAPDVARLSDEEETRLTMALAGGGRAHDAINGYLRLRGYAGGCFVVAGWEGDPADVGRRRARTAALLRRAGGLAMGRAAGEAWRRGRYRAPYLRDEMLTHGVMVETLETATTWSNLDALYRAVGSALRDALAARGTPPLVMCHVSHLYPAGASLYFTFIARQQEGAEIEQWAAAKHGACDAIVAAGGTITHHHAIGIDHAAWMEAEVGTLGLEALRALKARLDPSGIMNPGKLAP